MPVPSPHDSAPGTPTSPFDLPGTASGQETPRHSPRAADERLDPVPVSGLAAEAVVAADLAVPVGDRPVADEGSAPAVSVPPVADEGSVPAPASARPHVSAVEYAASGRSKCKACGEKIPVGEPRLLIFNSISKFAKFLHPECAGSFGEISAENKRRDLDAVAQSLEDPVLRNAALTALLHL